MVAVLIRQFALLLLFAFGVAYIVRRGVTWSRVVVATIPLVLGVALQILFQHWMITTRRTPSFELTSLRSLIPTPFGMFLKYCLRLGLAVPYNGFFLTPFLVSVALSGSYAAASRTRMLVCLLGIPLAAALLGGVYTVYVPVPEVGHILTPTGLGPRTLRDTSVLGLNCPAISKAGTVFWFTSIIVGSVVGSTVLLYLCAAAAQIITGSRRGRRQSEAWLIALMLSFIFSYAILLLLIGFGLETTLFDRYLLLPVPEIFMLILLNEISQGTLQIRQWCAGLSIALVIVYAIVDVAATHDYLAWNRARWAATRTLMDAGVSPRQIDGGYEFNGWYLASFKLHQVPNKSYWWVATDEYVIASGPMSGYRELQRFNF